MMLRRHVCCLSYAMDPTIPLLCVDVSIGGLVPLLPPEKLENGFGPGNFVLQAGHSGVDFRPDDPTKPLTWTLHPAATIRPAA